MCDLVQWQIRIALGESLDFGQETSRSQGTRSSAASQVRTPTAVFFQRPAASATLNCHRDQVSGGTAGSVLAPTSDCITTPSWESSSSMLAPGRLPSLE